MRRGEAFQQSANRISLHSDILSLLIPLPCMSARSIGSNLLLLLLLLLEEEVHAVNSRLNALHEAASFVIGQKSEQDPLLLHASLGKVTKTVHCAGAWSLG